MVDASPRFFVVGTPIGNLGDMTFRAVDILKSVDLIFCEDTRHSLKLLNHYEIKKPLRSCPYFKERQVSGDLVEALGEGKKIAYLTDAGTPNLSDPGATLVKEVRKAGFAVEVVGGVSALTYFMAGLGEDLESFTFMGFLPAKSVQRVRLIQAGVGVPTVFFESPHRIEATLKIFEKERPQTRLILAKELSKISERFFAGTAVELLKNIPSWKGEWVGLWFSEDSHVDS